MIRIKLLFLFAILIYSCSSNLTNPDSKNGYIFPDYISQDKLIAYYPFSSNVEDISINHNDGFPKDIKFTDDKNGHAKSAVEFSGETNQYIEVPFDSSMNAQESITISVWVYKKSDTTFQAIISRYIESQYERYRGWNFAFRSSEFGGNLYFFFRDEMGNYTCFQTVDSIASIIINGWHHLATTFTFGNEEMGKIYLDGQELDTEWFGPGRNTITISNVLNNNMFIGLSKAGPNGSRFHNFNGYIDELLIYSKALILEDIEKLRNGFNTQ